MVLLVINVCCGGVVGVKCVVTSTEGVLVVGGVVVEAKVVVVSFSEADVVTCWVTGDT